MKPVTIVIILVVVIALGVGVYLYMNKQSETKEEGASEGSESGGSVSERKQGLIEINQVAAEATRLYNSTEGSEKDKIKAIRPQLDRASGMGFTLQWEGGRFVPYSKKKEEEKGFLADIFGTKESRQAKRTERKEKRTERKQKRA